MIFKEFPFSYFSTDVVTFHNTGV